MYIYKRKLNTYCWRRRSLTMSSISHIVGGHRKRLFSGCRPFLDNVLVNPNPSDMGCFASNSKKSWFLVSKYFGCWTSMTCLLWRIVWRIFAALAVEKEILLHRVNVITHRVNVITYIGVSRHRILVMRTRPCLLCQLNLLLLWLP